ARRANSPPSRSRPRQRQSPDSARRRSQKRDSCPTDCGRGRDRARDAREMQWLPCSNCCPADPSGTRADGGINTKGTKEAQRSQRECPARTERKPCDKRISVRLRLCALCASVVPLVIKTSGQ